jgi:hypothetical protein
MRPVSLTRLQLLACALIAAGSVGVVLALADARTPLRTPLVLLFLAAAPAVAVAGLLRGLDAFGRIFAACSATIVINVLIAEAMLAAGIWSPKGGLVAVVVITALIGAAQLPLVRSRANRYTLKWRGVIRRLERL